MFTAKIVGTANAVAAGWGNMGAGLTHLIMPYILSGMEHIHPNFVAWRCAYMIPGSMQVIIGLAVLIFGQDLPDGASSTTCSFYTFPCVLLPLQSVAAFSLPALFAACRHLRQQPRASHGCV